MSAAPPAGLPERLGALATEMERIADDMTSAAHSEECRRHGYELRGAADIAREWAEELSHA